jgi:hypothetical protein
VAMRSRCSRSRRSNSRRAGSRTRGSRASIRTTSGISESLRVGWVGVEFIGLSSGRLLAGSAAATHFGAEPQAAVVLSRAFLPALETFTFLLDELQDHLRRRFASLLGERSYKLTLALVHAHVDLKGLGPHT